MCTTLPLSKMTLIEAVFYLGPHRDCVLMRSYGSNSDIQMWSASLGLAPALPPCLLCTLGFPTGACPAMCASIPMPINSVWYVVTLRAGVNFLNDPDPLSVPVTGCRSRLDLSTSTQSGSREFNRSKHQSSCPEIGGTNNPIAQYLGG